MTVNSAIVPGLFRTWEHGLPRKRDLYEHLQQDPDTGDPYQLYGPSGEADAPLH